MKISRPDMPSSPLPEKRIKKASAPSDYAKLSVLLNYKCNFSCSYCYSAKGRSGGELKQADLKGMLDYFIDNTRLDAKELTIFFSGGGEPLLSWDLMKFALEYSEKLADEQCFIMNYILITNGSLLDDAIIKILKKYNVNVCVSFEILKEIQDTQRGQYESVVAGISKLIKQGLIPSVSSTITVHNEGLMEQMVEAVNGMFPEITNLNFDPAIDPGYFSSPGELRQFYDSFTHNFFAAQKLAGALGCRLNCTMERKAESIRGRYCPGKLCLTPESGISICHSFSSPKEEAYESCRYGSISSDGKPEFDLEKFSELVNKNADSYEACKNCFARWNCAGGCLLYRNKYQPEMFEEVCNFTRDFLKRTLINRLESEYAGDNSIDTHRAAMLIVEDLLRADKEAGHTPPDRSVGSLTKLSILPNYTCNFSCSYCYAASGRSEKVLDKDSCKAVLDFFIDPARLKGRNLYLAILGGGEPLLSWDIVRFTVEYAREKAEKTGFNLSIGLTTNGSVIDEEMITFLKKHKVIMSISFEVLEDVQYSQRQQYRRVCATIDRLVAAGVELSFKSIITKQNVNRLEEMVEEVLNRFPSVKKLKLQPADDNAMFATVDELAEFYNAFTRNFFPAMKLGKKNGVDVYCLAYRNLDFIMDHFCSGEICLTPEGTISICHRVSSPQEADYEDFVYGNTGPSGNISFDYEKFRQLMRHDIYNQEKCLDCPARYHCGGGCLAQAHVFDKDKLDVICNWTRDFMRTALAD